MDRPIHRLLELGYAREGGKTKAKSELFPLLTQISTENKELYESVKSRDEKIAGITSSYVDKTKEAINLNNALDIANLHIDTYKELVDIKEEALTGARTLFFQQGRELEQETERADNILTQANENSYKYNSLRKKGGSYGILDHKTSLFNVTEWKPTIDQLRETATDAEIEDKLTAGKGLLPSAKLDGPANWFADSQKRTTFDLAYDYAKDQDQSIEYSHQDFGTMRGINFGAKSLFRINKLSEPPVVPPPPQQYSK